MELNARNMNRDQSYIIIRKNYVIIKDGIYCEDIIDIMFQEGILEYDEKIHIQDLSKRSEQNETLLRKLLQSSEISRKFFLELLESRYPILYNKCKFPDNGNQLSRGPSRVDSDIFNLKGAKVFSSREHTTLSVNQVSLEEWNPHVDAERCKENSGFFSNTRFSRNPTDEVFGISLNVPVPAIQRSSSPIFRPSFTLGNNSHAYLREPNILPQKSVVPPITGRSQNTSNTMSQSDLNLNQAVPTILINDVPTYLTDSKIIQSSLENRFSKLPGIQQKNDSPTAHAGLSSSKSFSRGLSLGIVKPQSGIKVPKDKRSTIESDNENVWLVAALKSFSIAPIPKVAKPKKLMPLKKFKKKNKLMAPNSKESKDKDDTKKM